MHSPTYLVIVAQENIGYSPPELESISKSFGISFTEKHLFNEVGVKIKPCDSVYLITDINEGGVKNLMSRAILSKSALELWACGKNFSDLISEFEAYPESLKQKYFEKDQSFSIRVKGIKKKVSLADQRQKVDSLEKVLPFRGKVELKNPDNEFFVLEDYSQHVNGHPPVEPSFVYFGRFLCNAQRSLMSQHSLKKRKFIGNTSMDPTLSIIMTNLAAVQPGMLVCDPFVGSGSILIPPAQFGAYIVGGDINYNIIHSRGKSSRHGVGWRQRDESICHNLEQYGLKNQYVDVLLCDAANHAWRSNQKPLFDAIITDPPYGIREGCSRIGSKEKNNSTPTELPTGTVHYPRHTAYALDDVFKDLLMFANRLLVVKGRLVYWLPVYIPTYTVDIIPTHPNLKLLYNLEQVLNRHSARRLIVMEKTHENSGSCLNGEEAHIENNVYKGHNAFRDKYFCGGNS